MRMGLRLGLPGAGQLASSVSPLSLFASGEKGVWFDPSDMATMYQDSLGSVPVTAMEQPVGLLLDKSANLALGAELVPAFVASDFTTSNCTISVASGVVTLTATATGVTFADLPVSNTTAWQQFTAQIRCITAGTGGAYISAGNGAQYTGYTAGTVFTPISGVYNRGVNHTIRVRLDAASIGDQAQFQLISLKSLAGNHASQATSTSRPVLSARYNQLLKTEDFSSSTNWPNVGGVNTRTSGFTAPDGSNTAWQIVLGGMNYEFRSPGGGLEAGLLHSAWIKGTAGETLWTTAYGNAASILTFTGDWQYISSPTTVFTYMYFGAYSGSTARTFYLWHPDARKADDSAKIPAYQRVDTATSYDTAGFPPYLKFDGVDDNLATSLINLTGTDKATIWTGYRCDLAAATYGMVSEYGAGDATSGLFALRDATTGNFGVGALGARSYSNMSALPRLLTTVFMADRAGTTAATEMPVTNVNGAVPTQTLVYNGGCTGNFTSEILHIGDRNGTTYRLKGRIYGIILRGAASTADQIAAMEAYMNGKIGAY